MNCNYGSPHTLEPLLTSKEPTTAREKAIWATGSTKVLKAERRDGAPVNPLLNLRLVPNGIAQRTLDEDFISSRRDTL